MTSPSSEQQLQGVPLVQKFNAQALELNFSLEQKWKNFKKEYEELYTCLEEFPKHLSVPILMPLGSKVFVRAQICNTNEVFIRYNEIFTKQSAYDAKSACKRQINRCNDMLENLRKEKELFMDNISARQEVVNVSEKLVEINEPYDEAEEAAWNEIHRQKVKEYKKRLAEEKHQQELEQRQKILNEFKSVGFDDKLKALERPTLFTASKVHYAIMNGEDISGCLSNENCIDMDDDDDDDDDMDDDDDDDDDDDNDDDVDDEDDDEDEDSKLEIVFTNDIPETTRVLKKKNKKQVSFNNDIQIKEFVPRPEEHFIRRRKETITDESIRPEIILTEIDDIVERVSDVSLDNETDNQEENTRPVSRFKSNRNR
ncbi:unconventional prefoldin RPB5 interactor-like protein [Melanaphis sacchari]|uniref:unconventional prefoldin RPB5 interactor-like protein n=1 Tax=Melanaphis sacchari TaxID=742174 RepID=UPI000DC14447|nr:unconventional prefoldin RPB5 interactor-like protein [Melanaphis sacchari]